TNRASSLGHPCERNLTYARVASDKRQKPTVAQQRRFQDGDLHEKAVLRILEDAGERLGFRIVDRQRDLSEDPFFKKHQISGHPDALVAAGGEAYPIDVKSCSPFVFQQLSTLQDMQRHKHAYVRAYPAQIQLYLLGTGHPQGAFLLKDKASGEPKQITAELDYQYAEDLVQKADRINAHVAAGTLPPPIDDAAVCQDCPFRVICPADISFGPPLQVVDEPELIEKLERRDFLYPLAKEYERLDKELKGILEGEANTLIGDFHISGKSIHRNGYTVEETDYWQTKIVRVQGQSPDLEEVA
ncbi:MAG: PD-(D/E)XK nuclease family protein, partial [Patescibacteria group bacterium]|nr:PD-(D/E)XK nuclease family protein [Patescibacteria group bacterium]